VNITLVEKAGIFNPGWKIQREILHIVCYLNCIERLAGRPKNEKYRTTVRISKRILLLKFGNKQLCGLSWLEPSDRRL
jgi:hypothetical protein